MDDHIPVDALPTLYRDVLETVARLERAGERSYAWKIRQEALRTYSTRWDDHGRRVLRRLDRDGRVRLEVAMEAVSRREAGRRHADHRLAEHAAPLRIAEPT